MRIHVRRKNTLAATLGALKLSGNQSTTPSDY